MGPSPPGATAIRWQSLTCGNPTRSDGYNLLTLINHYMDICREDEKNLAARAKAEKYAKILSKTIVNPDGDASQYGQNAFFYDAAEGLLTAVVLLLAEYLPLTRKQGQSVGTSSACSNWCRTSWRPADPQKAKRIPNADEQTSGHP